MTRQEIKELLELAKVVARARGHPQLADDFAQEAFIALAGGRKASMDQLLIDFLRKEYGSTGVRGGDAGKLKRGERANYVGLDDPGPSGRPISDRLAAPGGPPGTVGRPWQDRVDVRGAEATVYELIFEDERSLAEVAAILGVSESRVSQIGSRVKRKVEAAMVIDEMWDTYRDDKESSMLVVRWITL